MPRDRQTIAWFRAIGRSGVRVAAGLLYPFFGVLLNPVFAGVAISSSSVSVIANALRLRGLNPQPPKTLKH